MGSPERAPLASLGVGALVAVVVLLGLGAALLVGRAAESPVLATGAAPVITFSASPTVWAMLFLVPLVAGFLSYVLRFALDSAAGRPARFGAGAVIAVVVVLFVALLLPHAAWNGNSTVTLGGAGGASGSDAASTGGSGSGGSHGSGGGGSNGSGGSAGGSGGAGSGGSAGGSGGTGSGGTGSGGSGGGSSGGGSTGTGGSSGSTQNCTTRVRGILPVIEAAPIGIGNCTGGSGGGSGGSRGTGPPRENNTTVAPKAAVPARGIAVGVPNWVFLPVGIALSVVIGVLAIPGVLSRLVDRRTHRPAPPSVTAVPEGIVSAIQDARLAIESGERPRDAIVRLYGRLLGRVAPSVEELATSTAEEIRQTRFAALPVPAVRSEVITRLFEEARYSTHPIDQPVADRFVETLREVERDLAVAGAPR